MKSLLKGVLMLFAIGIAAIYYWLFIFTYQINTNLLPNNFVVVVYDGGKVKKRCELHNTSSEYKALQNFIEKNKDGWSLDYQMKMPKASFMSRSFTIELREKRMQISFLKQGSRGKTHVYREFNTYEVIPEVCGVSL